MIWQLFKPVQKIQKDRKLLRGADVKLARRSFFILPAYLLFYLFVSFFPGHQQMLKIPILAIGLVLLGFIIAAFWYILRFETIYPRGPAKWRQHFLLLNWGVIASWSVFSVLSYLQNGLDQVSYFACFVQTVLAAWLMIAFAPYRRFSRISLGILLLPLIIVLLFSISQESLLVALVFICFFLFLLRIADQLSDLFWEKVKKTYQLDSKNAEIARLQRELADISKLKEDFLANMSYELKTPLNSLLGMLALIGDTELSADQRKFHAIAQRSGESLLNLIDDIFDYTQLSFHRLALEPIAFDLRKMLDDLIEVLGPHAHQNAVDLCYELDQEVPRRVIGDPKRLEQILNNLLSNAIKLSHKGEVALLVHIEKASEQSCVLYFEVLDQGRRIQEERSERLFDAFTNSNAKETGSTTGLTLAICRELVLMMHGEIGVTSKVDTDRGGNFWFTVQLGISTQQVEKFKAHDGLKDKKVALVGFKTFSVNSLYKQLVKWGMEVEVINDAAKLLTSLENTTYLIHTELVIINQNLLNFKDVDASKMLALHPKYHAIKQLIVTSFVQRGEKLMVEHLQQFENVRSLIKPIRSDDLHAALMEVFGLTVVKKAREKDIATTSITEKSKEVLLVEDNKINQLVAMNMLQRLGYRVKLAHNGKEALGMLEDHHFDCVLMDCQMPVMDGYEATKEIRRRESGNRHLPIIALTANSLLGDEVKCISSGMDDYLPKPVSMDQLSQKLEQLIC